jgi:hypothetical protein
VEEGDKEKTRVGAEEAAECEESDTEREEKEEKEEEEKGREDSGAGVGEVKEAGILGEEEREEAGEDEANDDMDT